MESISLGPGPDLGFLYEHIHAYACTNVESVDVTLYLVLYVQIHTLRMETGEVGDLGVIYSV